MQTKYSIAPEVLTVLERAFAKEQLPAECQRCRRFSYFGKTIEEVLAHAELCILHRSAS